MRQLEDSTIDLIITDLPYGTTRCFWDQLIPFDPLWKQLYRIKKPGAAIVMTCAQPFTTALIFSNIERFAYEWIWNKKFSGSFVQAKRMPMRIHESVAVFGDGQGLPSYYPQMIKRDKPIYSGGNKPGEAIPIAMTKKALAFERKKYDLKYPTSIIEFSSREDRKEMKMLGVRHHPTQKPASLFEYLIANHSQPGDLVLDCCMGSGTSGVSAIRSNRRFIGFELNQEWFDVASVRIAFESVRDR